MVDLRMQKLGAMALQASSEEPLVACGWDIECFGKPGMARADIEKETKSSGWTWLRRVWNLRRRSDHGTVGGSESAPTLSGRGSPSTPRKIRNILEV